MPLLDDFQQGTTPSLAYLHLDELQIACSLPRADCGYRAALELEALLGMAPFLAILIRYQNWLL
jgi:hypothetical protein